MRNQKSLDKVEFGTLGTDNAVFLWLYCKNARPYKNYMGGAHDHSIPLVLTQFRWDGKFGAIGGRVDEGETLEEALDREVCEELGDFAVDAEPLCTHVMSFTDDPDFTFAVHTYCAEIDELTMYWLQHNAPHAARDYKPEVSGYCILHCRENIIPEIMKNNFAPSAKMELQLLLDKIQG